MTDASMKWEPKIKWDENGEIREVYGYRLDINYTSVGAPFWNTMDGKDTIPTYTLQDLLEKLPNLEGYYYPDLRQVTKTSWQVIYKPKLGELDWLYSWGKTPIEATFKMLKDLTVKK